jgi:hypothetical protein
MTGRPSLAKMFHKPDTSVYRTKSRVAIPQLTSILQVRPSTTAPLRRDGVRHRGRAEVDRGRGGMRPAVHPRAAERPQATTPSRQCRRGSWAPRGGGEAGVVKM